MEIKSCPATFNMHIYIYTYIIYTYKYIDTYTYARWPSKDGHKCNVFSYIKALKNSCTN